MLGVGAVSRHRSASNSTHTSVAGATQEGDPNGMDHCLPPFLWRSDAACRRPTRRAPQNGMRSPRTAPLTRPPLWATLFFRSPRPRRASVHQPRRDCRPAVLNGVRARHTFAHTRHTCDSIALASRRWSLVECKDIPAVSAEPGQHTKQRPHARARNHIKRKSRATNHAAGDRGTIPSLNNAPQREAESRPHDRDTKPRLDKPPKRAKTAARGRTWAMSPNAGTIAAQGRSN